MIKIFKKFLYISLVCLSIVHDNRAMQLFGTPKRRVAPVAQPSADAGNEQFKRDIQRMIETSLPKEKSNVVCVNMQQLTDQHNFHIVGFDLIGKNVKDIFNQSTEQANRQFMSFTQWFKNNPFSIGIFGLAFSYISLQSYLFYLTAQLSNNNCWSKWQQEKTVEQMYQIAQSQFSQVLLGDIQKVYTTVSNPTDFVTPLIAFMHDTEKETVQLNRYQKIINMLNKIRLDKLFLYDSKIFQDTPNRLQKLSYMKNTFLAWLADYKMSQTQKLTLTKSCPKIFES